MNTRSGMETLLRRVAEHVDPPCDTSAVTEPFAFSVNSLGVDPFIGRLVTGKVYGGIVKPGAKVHIIKRSPDVDDDNDGIAGGGAGGGGGGGGGGGSKTNRAGSGVRGQADWAGADGDARVLHPQRHGASGGERGSGR